MLALLQRVKSAQVSVLDRIVGRIGPGLLVFLGIQKRDTHQEVNRLVERVIGYRIFPDENDQMNRSIKECEGELLVVSQFTLAADTHKGMRPGFSDAALAEPARQLYDYFILTARNAGLRVACGEFGAKMEVALINDGPVTFLLRVEPK
jgi:D-tyrosyl-tRNA(Tyr) deacylase